MAALGSALSTALRHLLHAKLIAVSSSAYGLPQECPSCFAEGGTGAEALCPDTGGLVCPQCGSIDPARPLVSSKE